MGKKSTPAAPDYTAAAEKTAASSQQNTLDQTWANRPDMQTPWGSQTWQNEQAIDPSTGKPVTKWSSQINLDPAAQAALDDQQAIDAGKSGAAKQLLSQATDRFMTPTDYDSMNQLYNFGGPSDVAEKAMDATWKAQEGQLKQRRSDTETQLANMGLARGTEAWNREAARLDQGENTARLQAFETGQRAQAQEFGQQLQYGGYQNDLRQRQIAEDAQRRGQTLNELNALLSGSQVSMPSMPSFQNAGRAETTNYSGAAKDQYGSAMDAQKMKNDSSAATMQGIGSMAAMFAMSDRRVKTLILALGTLANGLVVWLYHNHITNALEAGLLAQDVQSLRPHAVRQRPDGYLEVCYTLAVE